MLEKGLIDEVKSLTEYQKLVPLQTVGYTEIFKYLEGTWDLDFAIEEIKKTLADMQNVKKLGIEK